MKRHRGHRTRWLVALLVVAAVVVSAVAIAAQWGGGEGEGIAGEAAVSASSAALGSSLREVVTTEDPRDPRRGWRSMGETTGAWLELKWGRAVEVRRVVLERNPLDQPGVTAGFLTFGDGSALQVRLSTTDRTTVVPLTPRQVERFRFTVSEVSEGARTAALTRVRVDDAERVDDVATDAPQDGDVSGSATLTSSAALAPEELQRLVTDDSSATGSGTTFADPGGGWVQLDWARPRELTTVAVAGAPGATGLRSGTLSFSDGSELTLGDVLADGSRPTVISFMPRATTSLRLTFDTLDGPGALTLGRLSTYQRSAPPVTARGAAREPKFRDGSLNCDQRPVRPSDAVGLVVTCPTTGAVVGDKVNVSVAVVRSYTGVSATVWPADPSVPAPPARHAVPGDDGGASIVIDLGGLPAGPLTVQIEATSGSRRPASVLFQLYREAGDEPSVVATSEAARGRALVYAEEFDKPLSAAPTGEGADYASKKPESWGGSEFGDAIFADPSAGFGNLRVVDDRYLKVSVQPRPAALTDPSGWGREHVGGLLASARPGGSGFSAQYGYFEARMLVPAALGTWPAFWAMPSANLVEQQPAVAEIDAVELYGHDPTTACHATHEYMDHEDGGEVKCLPRTWDTRQEAMNWHTYGVSVSPTAVTFYVDGRPVHTAPQVRGGDEPLFFMVNLALGGGWPVKLAGVQERADLYVDYIRVYV